MSAYKTPNQNAFTRVEQVQAKYGDLLMSYPNVIGLGVGYAMKNGESTDEPALIVLVAGKLGDDYLDDDDILPHEIDGVRVDVQDMGFLTAH
jgi:hypothetical protein